MIPPLCYFARGFISLFLSKIIFSVLSAFCVSLFPCFILRLISLLVLWCCLPLPPAFSFSFTSSYLFPSSFMDSAVPISFASESVGMSGHTSNAEYSRAGERGRTISHHERTITPPGLPIPLFLPPRSHAPPHHVGVGAGKPVTCCNFPRGSAASPPVL